MMRVAEATAQSAPIGHTSAPAQTGSSIIGVRYKDGILLACDTLVAYGSGKRYPSVQRFFVVGNHTVLTGSGDHSDLQQICKMLHELQRREDVLNDGNHHSTRALHSYLTRVLYERRNKGDPLWGTFVLAGLDQQKGFFLGSADMWGTALRDEAFIATSVSSYMAMPHLRLQVRPDMTEEEARQLLRRVFGIGAQLDMSQSQQMQFAKITEAGVVLEEPTIVTGNWERADYTKSRMDMPLCSYPY